MDPEFHLAHGETDVGIRVSGCVIEKLFHVELEVLCGSRGHVSGNAADCVEHGCVNGSSVVAEDADKLLDFQFLGRCEGVMVGLSTICTLVPYFGVVHGWGGCCRCDRALWPKRRRPLVI